ncbi:MAG TPA: CehA/McbA family metallohydrolase [Planctomycetota bacterium]|nr:CehA/McbA family metallohydrolase [Planctomycetota bacterium]
MQRVLIALYVVLTVSVFGAEPATQWYKGNTHTHTILCGHADSEPPVVAQWYIDRGYHFLCLSEHNKYIDPATVELPKDRRKDFILIPGQEITSSVHMTALNTMRLVRWEFKSPNKSEIVQNYVDGTREAGGLPILNHPNFQWALKASDILPVKNLHLFELYNGHPSVNNDGDETHPSTEVLWDVLLSDGLVVWGVSSDDMHNLKKWGPKISNPGRGWVSVRSSELTPQAITQAMFKGDFYSSSGVVLKALKASTSAYEIEVDEAATLKELESPVLITKSVTEGEPGWRIDFIGKGGKVLQSVKGTQAAYVLPKNEPYVRSKITYTRKTDEGLQQCFAWTQPVFSDDRLAKVAK